MLLTFHWARRPGRFVNKRTGVPVQIQQGSVGPQFTGTVREWYETLVETIIDCAITLGDQISATATGELAQDKKVMIRCNPETFKIVESSVLYNADTYPSIEGEIMGMRALVDETLDKELIMINVMFTALDCERVYAQGAVKVDWHG